MNINENAVLITGAASGIGEASVEKLVSEGHSYLILLDRDSARLQALEARLSVQGVCLKVIAVDVTDTSELAQRLGEELALVSSLKAVVLSHGIADENEVAESDVFDRLLNVNLTSCQRILALCDDKLGRGSSVVFVSSILGKMGNHRNTGYCTSKHAQLGLMRSLAMDWARRRIRVNAVLPCYVDTPMLRQELQKQANLTGSTIEQVMRKAKKRIPLRDYISASDVANAIYFLSSDDAKMITAQSLVIDGGSACGA